MILITRDTESGQACEENGLPCILLDNNDICLIQLVKLTLPKNKTFICNKSSFKHIWFKSWSQELVILS